MTNRYQDRIEQGRIEDWREDRGFGVIKTEAGESFFFHISQFNPAHQPKIGEQVVFAVGQNRQTIQGHLQAKQIHELGFVYQLESEKNQRTRYRNRQQNSNSAFDFGEQLSLAIGIGFYSVLVLLAVMDKLGWLVVGWYAVLGIIIYTMYAKDKAAAHSGARRTPEYVLHIVSALGGWVGTLLAQSYLRSKLQKTNFRMVYYLTVLVNLAGLVFILINREFMIFW